MSNIATVVARDPPISGTELELLREANREAGEFGRDPQQGRPGLVRPPPSWGCEGPLRETLVQIFTFVRNIAAHGPGHFSV